MGKATPLSECGGCTGSGLDICSPDTEAKQTNLIPESSSHIESAPLGAVNGCGFKKAPLSFKVDKPQHVYGPLEILQ